MSGSHDLCLSWNHNIVPICREPARQLAAKPTVARELSLSRRRSPSKTLSSTGHVNPAGQNTLWLKPRLDFYLFLETIWKSNSSPQVQVKTRSKFSSQIFRVGGWELYLTFHSYGQMVLYPWGYDRFVSLTKDTNAYE